MLERVRQEAIDRAFGRGAAGFVASSVIGWLIDQIHEGQQPQRLDTSRLEPGETYLVTTRPAMSRAERRDARQYDKAATKLAKASRPRRGAASTARKLSAAQRKAAKAGEGTAKRRRNERAAEALDAKLVVLTAPTPQQLKLETTVAEFENRLAAHRAAALAATAKSRRRTPRTKVFR